MWVAAAEVEQVQAVGGEGVAGAGEELPPESLSAGWLVGEAEEAGKVEGAVGVDALVAQPGQPVAAVVVQ